MAYTRSQVEMHKLKSLVSTVDDKPNEISLKVIWRIYNFTLRPTGVHCPNELALTRLSPPSFLPLQDPLPLP